ncbi:MAG: signal peptidase I [Cumulibacter sp.]
MIKKIIGATVTTLIVATAVGLVCWFVLAATTGASLITFRTGSMAPSMPQGAIAVAMPVKASEIKVNDVVTVQRPGESLPVTHRVVEVRTPEEATAPDGIPDDARELVLKGDDNDVADFEPYVVTDAKKVVFSLANAGAVLAWLKTPIRMGLMILLVGALTTWAFWPAREIPDSEDAEHRDSDGSADPPPDDDANRDGADRAGTDPADSSAELAHDILGVNR